MRSIGLLALVALFSPVLAVAPVGASEYLVPILTDDQPVGPCDANCTLREAIATANGDSAQDTIYLGEGTYELSISGTDEIMGMTGDLDILTSMEIIGMGPKRTIIDANSIDRVFNVSTSGVTLLLRGLTITGGWLGSQQTLQGSGLRLYTTDASVTLETCIVEENYSTSSDPTWGGAIYVNYSDLTVRDSLIRSNTAGRGGAIYIVGDNADVVIERSTIYNNTTFNGTGAVDSTYSTVAIDNSTISDNHTSSGTGGVRNEYGTMTITRSTLSGNTGAELEADDAPGGLVTIAKNIIDGTCSVAAPSAIDSNWFNLESPGDTCELVPVFDKAGVPNAEIDDLAWNGGPTPTNNPQPTSPVVDAFFPVVAMNCDGEIDQRGVSRPRDGEPVTDGECDIGAVERVPGLIFYDNFECGYTTSWSAATP